MILMRGPQHVSTIPKLNYSSRDLLIKSFVNCKIVLGELVARLCCVGCFIVQGRKTLEYAVLTLVERKRNFNITEDSYFR